MKKSLAFAALALLLIGAQGAYAEADGPGEYYEDTSWLSNRTTKRASSGQTLRVGPTATTTQTTTQTTGNVGSYDNNGYYHCYGDAAACEKDQEIIKAECSLEGGGKEAEQACRVRKSTGSVQIDAACDEYIATGKASDTAKRACARDDASSGDVTSKLNQEYVDKFKNVERTAGYVDPETGHYICTAPNRIGCSDEERALRHACENTGNRDTRIACHLALSEQRIEERRSEGKYGTGWEIPNTKSSNSSGQNQNGSEATSSFGSSEKNMSDWGKVGDAISGGYDSTVQGVRGTWGGFMAEVEMTKEDIDPYGGPEGQAGGRVNSGTTPGRSYGGYGYGGDALGGSGTAPGSNQGVSGATRGETSPSDGDRGNNGSGGRDASGDPGGMGGHQGVGEGNHGL